MAKVSKRMRAVREGLSDAELPLRDGLQTLCDRSKVKFDETVEVAVQLGVDPRHADQMVRGVCDLPHGTGKSIRVAVFARGEKAAEAEAAGADIVGAEDLIEVVQAGNINFDRCIATPDIMPLVSRLGQILGPRKLMPNPRVGTVTNDVGAAVSRTKKGTVEFRVERAGIVHASVGKISFGVDKLVENIDSLVGSIRQGKPSGAKGTYFLSISISSTMGPGLKIDNAALLA